MPIEYRNADGKSTQAVMTQCPFCENDLPDGTGFAYHFQTECTAEPTWESWPFE